MCLYKMKSRIYAAPAVKGLKLIFPTGQTSTILVIIISQTYRANPSYCAYETEIKRDFNPTKK